MARAAAICCCKSNKSAWARSTSISGTSPLASPAVLLDQLFGLGHRVQRARQRAAGLLHVEIRRGHRQQGIVLRRLQVRLAGRQLLAGGQRAKNGVGDAEVERRPAARRKGVLVVQDHRAVGGLVHAVVTVVVGAHVEIRQPQNLAP